MMVVNFMEANATVPFGSLTILETLLALAWLRVSYSGDASLHKSSCKLHAAASRKPTSLFRLTLSHKQPWQVAMRSPLSWTEKEGNPLTNQLTLRGLKIRDDVKLFTQMVW
jgi:hypothetical protein